MKSYLGVNFDDINRFGGRIPGFQMLKDRVIKPLIVASEKVVEYYLTENEGEEGPKSLTNNQNLSIGQNESVG